MTTGIRGNRRPYISVVEAYRLDRYDNLKLVSNEVLPEAVVEAYRLDRYDN